MTIHSNVKFEIFHLIEWTSIGIYFVKQPEQKRVRLSKISILESQS